MPRQLSSRSATLKAARLSRLPGVTMAAVCAQYGVSRAAVQKARKELSREFRTTDDLLLAALTKNGTLAAGPLPDDYRSLAAWFDYVDHDGCTPDEAKARVHALVERGWITVEGARWTLVVGWPRDDEPQPPRA